MHFDNKTTLVVRSELYDIQRVIYPYASYISIPVSRYSFNIIISRFTTLASVIQVSAIMALSKYEGSIVTKY